MNTEQKEKKSYTREYIVAVGYILFFCLASIFCLTFYYLTFSQQRPSAVNAFATNLPATTPSPHIPLNYHPEVSPIFQDNFSDNQNTWIGEKGISRARVNSGKLFIESQLESNYAAIGCGKCPYLEEPYYLQANLTTTVATDKGFGIIFNLNRYYDNFYLFQINTEAKKYYFYHHTKDEWSLRAAGESSQIKSFPASNTLGIYTNLDIVEFYINGKIIDSYKQSDYSFQTGYVGFYTDSSGFELVVDNLIIYKAGR